MPGSRRMRSRSSVSAGAGTAAILLGLQPDRDAGRAHALLGLANRVPPVVEYRGAEHGVGAARRHGVDEVVERAGAPACYDRHVHRLGDRAGQLQLVAVLGSVAVHAGEQDLPRPPAGSLAGPFDSVAANRGAPAIDVDAVVREGAG